MYHKLEAEVTIRNEILFFMHNCLTSDLNNRDMMLCAQVICDSLNSSKIASLDPTDHLQVYVLQRTLMALENFTRRNARLLSQLASDFQLHRSFVTIIGFSKLLQTQRTDDATKVSQLNLRIINRIIKSTS